MITAHDGKHPARIRELPLFYILDPGPIDPDGDIMLGFAGNRAGVAADAVAIVDDESKIQKCLLRKCTLCNNAFVRNSKCLT